MKVYVNSNNEIKDVGTCNDVNLMEVEISDEFNPFMGWSVAKICCHKVILDDGIFVSFTPYVDIKIIEHIERLATESEHNAERASFLTEQSEVLTATVDSILTDIIPSLMG